MRVAANVYSIVFVFTQLLDPLEYTIIMKLHLIVNSLECMIN